MASPSGLTHARFSDLGSHLEPGDLVVVNNSATLAAEFDGTLAGTGPVVVHAAAELDDGTGWSSCAPPRTPGGRSSTRRRATRWR